MFRRVLILSYIFFSVGAPDMARAETPKPLPGIRLNDLRLTPTQSGGRLKPFDEFARENLLAITGSRSFGDFDPSEMMISMMVNPKEWSEVRMIRISVPEVNQQLLLDASRKYFAPSELLSNNAFLQYSDSVLSNGTAGEQVTDTGVNAVTGKADPRSEELKRVVDRVSRFQAIVTGRMWAVTPAQDASGNERWKTVADGMMESSPQSQAIFDVLKNYLDKKTDALNSSLASARQSIESAVKDYDQHKNKILAETFYNRLRPFLQAMIFYLIAGIFWLFAGAHVFPRILSKFLTICAVAMHALGFALRCYVAGRPPVTNMYESIIWVSLGVMVFAMLLFLKNRQNVLMTTATFLAGLSLFAADAAPMVMDPTIRPLVPVLRSNYWLTIHVLTITLSYGAFMLAMGIANVALYWFYEISKKGETRTISERIALLNQLAYRALMFGTVLLAAGTILGGVWADYSWGRFWGWDPKEVWALIALLSYMAVLHGRYTGWVGKFAFPLWTVICFSTVVMAWYGVNFVLGVGLHSYGFSTGGQAFVFGFLLLQTTFCLWVAYHHQKWKKSTPAGQAG
ncbi:MAG: cytochrome c biogenesis protein CcsA [Bdellovibrionales bacterium]|nr:cytochrome c biogenesis protein CcsA [Bdellovibrionales bacterium]